MADTLINFQKLFHTFQKFSLLKKDCVLPISNNLSSLGVTPTKEEIKEAIFSFKPLKAPGPNGLHPFFYQKYWEAVGPSVINMCGKIFRDGQILEKVNETHICLIPKKKGANDLKNFRLISLCNTTYKIITKIIINRLKPQINDIIGSCQTSFLKNKQVGDNAIIVQENVSHFNKMKGKNLKMIVKIDLEKAFDKLEWSYIKDTLLFFSFPDQAVQIVMSCISTNKLSYF